jgi:AcrR family transcriptional regulator
VVATNGYHNATIDQIAEKAGVSPRTFFNYFHSKDHAIFGDEPTLDPQASEDFLVPDGPLLEDLFRLIVRSVGFSLADSTLPLARREFLQVDDGMIARSWARTRTVETQLESLVRQRLERTNSSEVDPRLVALLVIAIVRVGWTEWTKDDSPRADLISHLRAAWDRAARTLAGLGV